MGELIRAGGVRARAVRRGQAQGDRIFQGLTFAAASLILLLLLAMTVTLFLRSGLSLERFGLSFLTTRTWDPVRGEFGALGAIWGTLVSTLIALLLATPFAAGVAIFLAEMASPRLRSVVGTAVELLAAVPSIIYGMWGLFFLAPHIAKLQQFLYESGIPFADVLFSGPPVGVGMGTAGVVLAIMILPFMASVTRDVLMMAPVPLKESAVALGATTFDVVRQVVVPYGVKGIFGAFFLGMGRALGETMAVTFVVGNAQRVSLSLFEPGSTIASTLANEFAEASDPLHMSVLMELGLVLFLITFAVLGLAEWWVRRIVEKQG